MAPLVSTSNRPQNIHVIANPASGRRIPLLQILNDSLRPHGISWDLSVTHETGDGQRAATRAIENGADLIVSFGGDGTVMDVTDALMGTDVPLLILSGGTGNLVASELDLPRDVERALSRITNDSVKTRLVDVGKMADRHFLLRVGCGFEASVLQDASREMKNQFGKWAYIYSAVKALMEVKVAKYRLTIDGNEEICSDAVACSVANFGTIGVGELSISPRIGIDDGKLDLILIRKADAEGIYSLIKMMMGVGKDDFEAGHVLAKIDESHLVQRWRVENVKIETDPPLEMQADGDLVAGTTPQTVEIVPRALRVVV